MKAPRSPTTLGTGIGAEDAVLGGIAAVSLSFGAGLLAVALALPLYWLPGQLALLCLLLPALAGIGVVTARRLAGLIGIAAADFAIRVRLTRWIVVGMSMAALPLAEAHLMGRSVNAGGLPFTIAVSVAACWVVSAAADGLTRAWATLQVQPWETTVVSEGGVSAVSLERAGRVDRGKILHDLWRGWLAGEVGLAVALLIRSQLVQSDEGSAWASLLAFGIYTLAGLLVLSQAARARQTIQWQLSGLAVPPELEGAWSGAGIRAAAAAMLGIGLLLLVHALDLAHGIVNWVAVTLLLPLLGPLGRWFEQLGNQVLGNCAYGRCGAPSAIRKTPPPPRPPPPLGHHAGGPNLGWLVHAWPAILAILVIGVVVRLYWGTRGSRGGRGIWEEMLAILSGNLRRLFRLLRQPARLIAARIGARALEPGQRRFRLPRRRDQGAWATSRQAIISLYLAALAQAARRGHPRRPGQTPTEYATELAPHLPDSDDTLGRMTELFTAVRYGEEPADPEAVGRMRGWWAAFRDLLRGSRASG
jgi:hypothetical protein